MGSGEIIEEALRIARTHKSLWLFGFFVGLGGSNFGIGGVVGIIVATVAFVVLRFLGTSALIEGVTRARRNGRMTVREGFREGWANWGVLFLITLVFLPMNLATVALLGGACYLVWTVFGSPAAILAACAALLLGVPCLLTLYMWQMFAERIAVLENRRALDAMRKARLFLHGRLQLGLKLFVADLLGGLFVTVVGLIVIVPIAFVFVSARVWAASEWGALAAVGLGVLTVAPLLFVAFAFFGIMTTSVWTIGYLTQVEQ
ncbi:MAG TPA: hypothetical protein VFL84_09485 [Gammaproteobacteria bacterium]|nr:hypothetical protein [Gammaproteobacteria bacterium]